MNNQLSANQIHGKSGSKEKEYLEGWQRSRAEFANFKTQLDRDKDSQTNRLKRDLIEPLIQLADNFHSIVNHTPEEIKNDPWSQGIQHVVRQFDQILQDYDVKKISEIKQFNPEFHEAVSQIKKKGISSGTVLEVIQPGYMIGDTVVRPAKVKVAK